MMGVDRCRTLLVMSEMKARLTSRLHQLHRAQGGSSVIWSVCSGWSLTRGRRGLGHHLVSGAV